MNYRQSIVKRNIEYFLVLPIILLGKIAGKLFPLRERHSIFLFFSSADVGGSVKVNADIVNCIKDRNPIIIFSKKSSNNEFIHLFNQYGVRIVRLDHLIDYKVFHFINIFFRGVIASWVNKNSDNIVFGGECLYFYKILPHLKKHVKKIELSHLNTWINYNQSFVKDIDLRIFSTKKIMRDVQRQYYENGVSKIFNDRLFFIDNMIEIPPFIEVTNQHLQVLFVGRGSPQKRVHIIAAIAKKIEQFNLNIHFTFVGDVDKVIPIIEYPFCTFCGIVKDKEQLNNIYNAADMLILTSAYEGLPIVVMDMMARGKIVMSTAVDGIPDYITHLENGLLLFEKAEDQIISEAIDLLQVIINDNDLFKKLQTNSKASAENNFSKKAFNDFYRHTFISK